jgi:hypothetical protein
MNDLSGRKPCSDGNCIGTINEQGYCRICGKFADDIDLEKETLKFIKFPDLPKAPTSKPYQSVFLPVELKTRLHKGIHLEDYSLFFSSIQNAAHYRLPARISNSLIYPFSQPGFPIFPGGGKLSPRHLPPRPQKVELKWYDYVLVRRLRKRIAVFNQNVLKFEQEKRKVDEVNEWLSKVYRPTKERFDKACQMAIQEWEEAKLQWETEASLEKTKLEQLRSQY